VNQKIADCCPLLKRLTLHFCVMSGRGLDVYKDSLITGSHTLAKQLSGLSVCLHRDGVYFGECFASLLTAGH
jgi:hypothetical protein